MLFVEQLVVLGSVIVVLFIFIFIVFVVLFIFIVLGSIFVCCFFFIGPGRDDNALPCHLLGGRGKRGVLRRRQRAKQQRHASVLQVRHGRGDFHGRSIGSRSRRSVACRVFAGAGRAVEQQLVVGAGVVEQLVIGTGIIK